MENKNKSYLDEAVKKLIPSRTIAMTEEEEQEAISHFIDTFGQGVQHYSDLIMNVINREAGDGDAGIVIEALDNVRICLIQLAGGEENLGSLMLFRKFAKSNITVFRPSSDEASDQIEAEGYDPAKKNQYVDNGMIRPVLSFRKEEDA